MKAVTWHGRHDVRVETVPDPVIKKPTDAIVRITSTAICGSDLHLYGGLIPVMKPGDTLGHEPMGIVEEIGSAVTGIAPGDRVVVPFNIACGACFLCERGYYSQCETTQNKRFDKGGSLFGYTRLYGGVPGAQAEYLRVPMAHFGPIKVPEGPPDERFLFLSDILPTAWQAVAYAEVPANGTVAVFGLGPVGQFCARIALHQGAGRVIGIDAVPERLELAKRYGVEPLDFSATHDVSDAIADMTAGRGADSVIDAVGMEAAGSALERVLQRAKIQPDRFKALRQAMDSVRRGGTLSVVGVYGGMMQRFPIGALFDKQVTLRWGQCNVRSWLDQIMPLLGDDDPLGTQDLTTHALPLAEAPHGYRIFQEKRDRCVKVVLRP